MNPRAALPLSLLLAPLAVLGIAGRPAAQATPDQAARFGARTEAVVVDVTVVDKKGRPVTTLAQSDFELFEDGDPQTILSFDRHAPNPNATAEDAAAELGLGGQNRASRASARGPSVTAIAFDRLSPEGRMLAYRAAKRFVQNKQADELAGVFIVDQALRTLAPRRKGTATRRPSCFRRPRTPWPWVLAAPPSSASCCAPPCPRGWAFRTSAGRSRCPG